MSETYPLALPTVRDTDAIQITTRDAVAVSESPISFSQQAVRHPGQAWGAHVNLPPMNRDEAEVWVSFLLRLRGQYGTFTMGDPTGATSRGIASWWPGTPVVKGASQTGGSLIIDGAPAGQTAYLMSGDYIQLGSGAVSRLHKVLEDADSDSTGTVTLNIWPDLRTSPADNATVVVKNAVGVFRRAENTQAWDISTAVTFGINFAAEEAL